MTTNELLNIIEVMPDVRLIDIEAGRKRDAISKLIPLGLNEVVLSYDWEFAIEVGDENTVVGQAEYTLDGNNSDCRDIINVRYGTTSDGFVLLDKLRPVDRDDFLSGRTVTGIGWWIPTGRDINGFPKIELINAPSGSTNVIRYRYRRNNVKITEFPEYFGFVLVSSVVKRLIPDFGVVFRRDLETMIDHYSMAGGEDLPAPLDPVLVARNNERAGMYGYS